MESISPIRIIDQLCACDNYRIDKEGCMVRVERHINAQTKIAIESAEVANNNIPAEQQTVKTTIKS